MPSYVAFLRAINLGPTRKVPMADLRECLTESGLEDVATHIQTGNILLRTRMRSTAAVERHVETALAERYGFEVPTVAFTTPQFRQVYDDAAGATPPHDKVTGERRYVQLFKAGEAPTGEVARAIEAWDRPGEAAVVIGRTVHIWLDVPTAETRFFGEFRKPLEPGTNRNLTVIRTLAEKWTG